TDLPRNGGGLEIVGRSESSDHLGNGHLEADRSAGSGGERHLVHLRGSRERRVPELDQLHGADVGSKPATCATQEDPVRLRVGNSTGSAFLLFRWPQDAHATASVSSRNVRTRTRRELYAASKVFFHLRHQRHCLGPFQAP